MSKEDIENEDVIAEEEEVEEEDGDDVADEDAAEDEEEENEDGDGDDVEADDDETERLRDENARLRKALKKKSKRQAIAKTKGTKITKKTTSGAAPTVEDMFIVTSNQLDQTEYEQARKIAQLEDIELADAVNSKLFTAWRTGYKEDLKKEKAALGTSRGSGKVKKAKTFATVKKRDDHRALWKQRLAK